MSRYAGPRHDERRRVWPDGVTRGTFLRRIYPRRVLEDQLMRRHIVARNRDEVLAGYNAERATSLEGPSIGWMLPPGRVRYRWVPFTAPFGPDDGMVELLVAVFPDRRSVPA